MKMSGQYYTDTGLAFAPIRSRLTLHSSDGSTSKRRVLRLLAVQPGAWVPSIELGPRAWQCWAGLVFPVCSSDRTMSNAKEFYDFAQDCLRSASETRSEQHRDALTKMAANWRRAALEIMPVSGVARRKRRTLGLRIPRVRDTRC